MKLLFDRFRDLSGGPLGGQWAICRLGMIQDPSCSC